MNEKCTIEDIERFVSSRPFDKELSQTARELIIFMDSLPCREPSFFNKARSARRKIRRTICYAISNTLEDLARKARYAA